LFAVPAISFASAAKKNGWHGEPLCPACGGRRSKRRNLVPPEAEAIFSARELQHLPRELEVTMSFSRTQHPDQWVSSLRHEASAYHEFPPSARRIGGFHDRSGAALNLVRLYPYLFAVPAFARVCSIRELG
jgi:hypothetical protein